MDIRKLRRETENLLNKVDFDAIWRGFHKYDFAFYDDEKVYFADGDTDRDNRFTGNTSIDFEGRRIAIWNIDGESEQVDVDEMAANLVHEMFHCYQAEQGETRYPDDLRLLSYPDSLENYSLKYYENVLLADSLDDKNKFDGFLSVRKRRIGLLGAIAQEEFRAETVEGLAEYCGLMALKELSPKKYSQKLNNYRGRLRKLSNEQFDIRRISYFSGALLAVSALNRGCRFDSDLSTEKTLYEQISTEPKILVDSASTPKKEVERVYKEYVENKKKTISDFESSHTAARDCDCLICGYDPMNMIRVNDKLFCTHFIMLSDGKNGKPAFIKGPLLLIMKKGSDKQIEKVIL